MMYVIFPIKLYRYFLKLKNVILTLNLVCDVCDDKRVRLQMPYNVSDVFKSFNSSDYRRQVVDDLFIRGSRGGRKVEGWYVAREVMPVIK